MQGATELASLNGLERQWPIHILFYRFSVGFHYESIPLAERLIFEQRSRTALDRCRPPIRPQMSTLAGAVDPGLTGQEHFKGFRWGSALAFLVQEIRKPPGITAST